MVKRKRKEKNNLTELFTFNPSSRINSLSSEEDYDYVRKVISEEAEKFTEKKEKEIIIMIMAKIRQKLREEREPFARKLRDLLDLNLVPEMERKFVITHIEDFSLTDKVARELQRD